MGVAEDVGVAVEDGLALTEGVGLGLRVVMVVGVFEGFALARALGVEEKPPRPILIESAAIATSPAKAPIVPRLKVGFGSTLASTFGPFGRLVLPPLRCTGGCDDNVLLLHKVSSSAVCLIDTRSS